MPTSKRFASIWLTRANYRALRRLQREVPARVTLESLCNLCLSLGMVPARKRMLPRPRKRV